MPDQHQSAFLADIRRRKIPAIFFLLPTFCLLLVGAAWYEVSARVEREYQIEVDSIYLESSNLARAFEDPRMGADLFFSAQSISDLRLFAQFHDIGKVGIPDSILLKPGPLTTEERTEMQRHPEIGHRIAQSAPDLAPIADWVLKHHEWWNGNGYPLGLAGIEIPLECRILAIADAYDAMTSDRPYRKSLSHGEALREIKNCSGTQFDPELVTKFITLYETSGPDEESGAAGEKGEA